ncbi:MAG: asparagine synthetase B, partial [Bacteroidetes bacterium]|nr:asparagine synthetase B [Bacteroidota bacterium]
MTLQKIGLISIFILMSFSVKASFVVIPMDVDSQNDHLKAYGITYWVLSNGQK